MKPSFWQRLDDLARQSLPMALALVLVLITMAPLGLPVLHLVTPSLALIAVFYWSLYRPDLMPATAAFALGLADDLLRGGPLGISALVFTLVHATVTSQRLFLTSRSFWIIWLAFATVAGGGWLLAWLLVSAVHGTTVHGAAALVQFAATVGCLPLVWQLLVRCHLVVLTPDAKAPEG